MSEPKKMDLGTMELKDLKAMAYDLLGESERIRSVLMRVNQAISKKQSESMPPTPEQPQTEG